MPTEVKDPTPAEPQTKVALSLDAINSYAEELLGQQGATSIAKRYISRFQEIGIDDKRDKQYFSRDADGNLIVDDNLMLYNIKTILMEKAFPNATQEYRDDLFKKIKTSYQTKKDQILEDETETEESPLENDQRKIDALLLLYGEIESLRSLRHEHEVMEKIATRKVHRADASNPKKAAQIKVDVEHLFTPTKYDFEVGDDDSQVFYPNSLKDLSLSISEARCKDRIGFHERNLSKILHTNGAKDGFEVSKVESAHLKNSALPIAKSSLGLLKSFANHVLTRGTLTDSKATDNPIWHELREYENQVLGSLINNPNLPTDIQQRLKQRLESLSNQCLSKADFDILTDFIKGEIKAEDEERRKYLEMLANVTKDVNEKALKAIGDDTKESDELHKYRLIQMLLICAPFFPIPIVGLILEAFQPFLSGAMNFPQFLSNIFSMDGPFGKLAFFTDKMELDKLVNVTIGEDGFLGGPMGLLNTIVQNPITTPIMGSVGTGMAGSPLTGLAFAAFFGGYSGYLKREFGTTAHEAKSSDGKTTHYKIGESEGRREKAGQILSNAKKEFSSKYDKLISDELGRQKNANSNEKQRDFISRELEVKKDIFTAREAVEWLQIQDPDVIKSIICSSTEIEEKAKVEEKVKSILDQLGQEEPTDLIMEFYKDKNNKLFKTALALREEGAQSQKYKDIFDPTTDDKKRATMVENLVKDAKYDNIKAGLEKQFLFSEAGKNGIKCDSKDTAKEVKIRLLDLAMRPVPSSSCKPNPPAEQVLVGAARQPIEVS